jgi:hypothetical protein
VNVFVEPLSGATFRALGCGGAGKVPKLEQVNQAHLYNGMTFLSQGDWKDSIHNSIRWSVLVACMRYSENSSAYECILPTATAVSRGVLNVPKDQQTIGTGTLEKKGESRPAVLEVGAV